jgi:hypothetical protein
MGGLNININIYIYIHIPDVGLDETTYIPLPLGEVN